MALTKAERLTRLGMPSPLALEVETQSRETGADLANSSDPLLGAALIGYNGNTVAASLGPIALAASGLNLSPNTTPDRRATYTDIWNYVSGRPYLGAWFKRLRTTSPVGVDVAKVILQGDSIIATGPAGFVPDVLLKRIARARGFALTTVNDGHSGKTTQDWLSTYLSAIVAAHASGNRPHLTIINYGMNDPDFNETGQTITPAQTAENYRTGIRALRTGNWTVDQCSILVIAPTTANDDTNGRNEAWREEAHGLIRQVCADEGAAFFDQYAFARDVRRHIVTGWMDAPYGDARKIHPQEDFNLLLWGAIADIIMPPGLEDLFGTNGFENVSGFVVTATLADAPNTYRFGKSVLRCLGGGGWPHDGMVETTYHSDKIAHQICTGYADFGVAVRAGYDTTWGPWRYLGNSPDTVATAATNFTQGGGSPTESIRTRLLPGGMAHLGMGFVFTGTNGVPAVTIAAATPIATIASGHRPNRVIRGVPLQLYQGTATFRATPGYADIGTDGVITVRDAIPETIARVYIGPLSYAVA